MEVLCSPFQALEVRLADLARGFEEATVDKNDQLEKTVRMDKMLETATRFRKVSTSLPCNSHPVCQYKCHSYASFCSSYFYMYYRVFAF